MTLASDSRKTSSERFGDLKSPIVKRTHAETLPPTLLRLPSLSKPEPDTAPVVSQVMRGADCESHRQVAEQQAPVETAEPSVPRSSTINAIVPDSHPNAPILEPSQSTLLNSATLRDYNVAAFVDRVVTRKTLSAALVVVAGIAIWMPRRSDPNDDRQSQVTGVSDVGIAPASPVSENPIAHIARTPSLTPHSSISHSATEAEFVANAATSAAIQPGFSDGMAQTKSAPMESATIPDLSGRHETALYDMDPMASAANDQIRRMDASYADLPSVSATNAVAFEAEAFPSVSDASSQSGPLSLSKSRTPQPIVNWTDYLPPIGTRDDSAQLAGKSASVTAASARTVAAKPSSDGMATTSLPAAPDFSLALPGDGELIEADAHVAMPPLGSADQNAMR